MPFSLRTSILLLAIFVLAGAANAADEMDESMSGVKLASNDTLGTYLVNETGFTLYYFLNDSPGNGTSTCYGGCLEAWPAFYMENMTLPQGLNASDFTEAMRTDDIEQTAYKGWPLYFYYEDEEPGDILGHGVNDVWFIVVPDEFMPMDA